MDHTTAVVIILVAIIAGFTIVGVVNAIKWGPRLPEPESSPLAEEIRAIENLLISPVDKADLIRQLIKSKPGV